jgi:hypothetical protein
MPFPLIPLIIAGVSAVMQAQGGRKDAALLEAQGKAASDQSRADSEQLSRDYRQLVGTQAAAMAENGGGYGGSNLKLISQGEALANLDRLKILYHGELSRRGLESSADSTLSRAYIGAGTSLLSAGSSAYTRGKTMPGGY